MIVAGIDIGSLSGKCVIIQKDSNSEAKILSSAVIYTSPDSEGTAREVMQKALGVAGLRQSDLSYIVSTGYGRVNVPFANENITEISCHAKGVNWLFPEVRTILDVGGQDCKAISCKENGKVVDFVMNDKCAAGTGRYLERIAATLGVGLEEVGPLSIEGYNTPELIKSYCAVFAERDVINLLRQGKKKTDIMAGACDALVKRFSTLILKVGMREDFAMSGGVAKNIGIVKRLEARFGVKVYLAPDPQIIGALGAAIFALGKADLLFTEEARNEIYNIRRENR